MPLPDLLSLARIVAVPAIMVLVLTDGLAHNFGLAAALFTVTALTDYADGYLARRRGATTVLGAFLDSTADKLLVSGALLALLAVDRVSVCVVFIIIGREVTIMALRGLVAVENSGLVKPSIWGKLKANLQFIAIGLAMLRLPEPWGPLYFDEWVMLAAVVVTVYSGAEYMLGFRHALRSARTIRP